MKFKPGLVVSSKYEDRILVLLDEAGDSEMWNGELTWRCLILYYKENVGVLTCYSEKFLLWRYEELP